LKVLSDDKRCLVEVFLRQRPSCRRRTRANLSSEWVSRSLGRQSIQECHGPA